MSWWKKFFQKFFHLFISRFHLIKLVKVAQINYVSRNHLHCTANLNFGLIFKKAKHCWTLLTNFSFLFSWYFFLIMFCFLLNWRKNSNYFKIAVWWSNSMKQNFREFTFYILTCNSTQCYPSCNLQVVTSKTSHMGTKTESHNMCSSIDVLSKGFIDAFDQQGNLSSNQSGVDCRSNIIRISSSSWPIHTYHIYIKL